MKNLKIFFAVATAATVLSSCNKDPKEDYTLPPVQDVGKVTLEFKNYFGNEPLQLNHSYTSNGQQVSFSEVKYVITNISMITKDGTEVVYNQENLDKAGYIISQAAEASQTFVLDTMAAAKYKTIRFGLGIKENLNDLEEARTKFPAFYRLSQEQDMQWAWSNNFLFAKIKGTYGGSNDLAVLIGNGQEGKKLHSTWNAKEGIDRVDVSIVNGKEVKRKWKQSSRNAFRYIVLDLPDNFSLAKGGNAKITIKADLDKLLNGANKITLNAKIPEGQENMDMALRIMNNIGGRNSLSNKGIRIRKIKDTSVSPDVDLENVADNTVVVNSDAHKVDSKGMFSVLSVQ
ncbi:MbnP family protein [Capnocytophaga sp. oral taxon 338]|uniref:MbnP family protein n=1 Tax=Capnocytophaga sp. oral taxon 338 TaxID=710239 RepID=UPI000202B9C0|nr:MbnP family protein [Capnocytophaga sp. oral taxon 338]EGD34626.1 hypothetical protein HMPREF9071_0817 [Capnocytophaga sp. oral taxon 338 str. F0234]